jgi:hypothetical protein
MTSKILFETTWIRVAINTDEEVDLPISSGRKDIQDKKINGNKNRRGPRDTIQSDHLLNCFPLRNR